MKFLHAGSNVTYSYLACVYNSSSVLLGAYPYGNVKSGTGTMHTIFTTSQSYNGDLGGIAGADAKCQALATAASLPGTYKALLSSLTVSAKDRVPINGPVRLVNGDIVAANSASFWGEVLANSLSLTESGATVSGNDGFVWTNMNPDGSIFHTGDACSNFASTSGYAKMGTWASRSGPFSSVMKTCSGVPYSLYCISQ